MTTPVFLERPAGYVTIRCATFFANADEADAYAQKFRDETGRVVGLVHYPNRLNRQPYAVIAKPSAGR